MVSGHEAAGVLNDNIGGLIFSHWIFKDVQDTVVTAMPDGQSFIILRAGVVAEAFAVITNHHMRHQFCGICSVFI